MNIAVLRAEGSDAVLEALRQALDLKIDAEWKKGELRRRESVHEHSGFNACVADVTEPAALIAEIRNFLKRCRTHNIILSSNALTTQLDIGILVGHPRQSTASVVFSVEDLRLFSELGLEISISVYPGSDDEEQHAR